MCAVCEKRNGQNAKRTPPVAAAAASPVSRRASSHIVTTDAANENSTTELCAASALWVSSQAGIATIPAPMFASE